MLCLIKQRINRLNIGGAVRERRIKHGIFRTWLAGKPIKTYYWTRRVKRYKSGGLYGKLGQNMASYCGGVL